MGSGYSHNQDSVLRPPDGYVVPRFPSLYDPRDEFHTEEPAVYLFYSKDIFRFTLYWTLIMYGLTYGLCGIWAGIIAGYASRRKERRFQTAVIAFLPFILFGSLSAVVGSAVIGYVLAAVYSVGSFTMSTWVPFLWAFVQICVAIMGSYSTNITLL